MTRGPARLTRRRFLKVAGWAGVAAALAACDIGRVSSPSTMLSGSAAPTISATPSATPTATPSATATPGPTLRQQIAGMLLVGFRGTNADEASATVADIRDLGLGGVVLFDFDSPTGQRVRNIVSPGQLTELVAALREAAGDRPLIVAVDEEGGQVARLDPDHGFPATLSAAELGARDDPAFTQARATELATTLRGVGIDLNLAPVVDLNLNPSNPIIGALGRSFGADPDLVVAQAEAFVAAHREIGVRTALKHFPGHGSATADTHLGVVDVTSVWEAVELEPFRRMVTEGLADAVLTAHVFNATLDPEHPATLSRPIVTGLLREQLGWDGVVISDDMQMGAIRAQYGYPEAIALAIEAGIDLLTIANQQVYEEGIVGSTIDLIEGFVRDGRISASRIAASTARLSAFSAVR
ncbi:MAG: glycoside hydrolase family 3 N-terminal domain-containing protein [Chloroflexota bacterium]